MLTDCCLAHFAARTCLKHIVGLLAQTNLAKSTVAGVGQELENKRTIVTDTLLLNF